MFIMKTIENHALTGSQAGLISKVERFQGAFEATKFQRPALVASLKKSSIITSSGASTRIEGAMLADEQVKELVDKGCKITSISSRSEREVAGYVKALTYIYDNFEKLDISEKTIRELHQLLTGELTEDQLPSKQRGAYKDVTNDVVEKDTATGKIIRVWFKTTPPGPATQSAMSNLIVEYGELKSGDGCHPLILIGGFIVHFLAIHPFRDGNGRLSRLLTTLLLLRHDYKWAQYTSHEKVIEDNKENYYVCLRSTQSTFEKSQPDYEKWISFFLKTVSIQAEFLSGKIIQESPTTVMNDNEKNVYQIIKTAKECNVSYILENTEMSRAGLKDLIKRLIDKDLIKKQGQGKGTTYLIK
jgi:Fic family protein